MNDQRPTRWPCSADSSRNAGPGAAQLQERGDRRLAVLEERVADRHEVVLGRERAHLVERRAHAEAQLATQPATATQHLLGVGEREAAAAQQHGEVVEHVGGLLGHPLVGLLARRARHLLGLLADLLADERRVGEQLRRVGARRRRLRARGDRALERGQRLVRRLRLELAAVEARALAGVARRPGGLDQREQRVAVAVVADRLDGLRVARGRALVPQLGARAAPEVQLAGPPRRGQRLGVHVGEREHLAGAPVLDHAGHEALLVVGDRRVVHPNGRHASSRPARARGRRADRLDSGDARARADGRRARREGAGAPGSRYQPNARRQGRSRPITASSAVSARGGSAGIRRCSRSAVANAARVGVRERAVGRERLGAGRLPGQHAAQLAPAGDAEVERRPDPLARQRQAVAGAVAGEEDAVLDRRPQRVREPVALVAHGRHAEPPGDRARRLLDVVARLVGADARRAARPPRAPTRRSRGGSASGRSRRRGRCRRRGRRDGPRARARSAPRAAARSARARGCAASRARRRPAGR